MNVLTAAMLMVLQAGPQSIFSIHCDLQGLYDEMSQATLTSRSAGDVDMFHEVFYTPDWTFVDTEGQRHSWAELRQQAIDALTTRPFTGMHQVIHELTPRADSATVTVNVITVKKITDSEGRYGRAGLAHTIYEITPFRDTWLRAADSWKLQMREQVGSPRTLVDQTPSDLENPRWPS